MVHNIGAVGTLTASTNAGDQNSASDLEELALLQALTAHINEGRGVGDLLTSFLDALRQFLAFDRLEYAVVKPDEHTVRTAWVSDDLTDNPIPVGWRYTR